MRKIVTTIAGSLFALSAGAGIASASMSAADLQQAISAQLAQAGATPESVNCPGDLGSEVGDSVTCAVTIGGETRGLTVTVASVDNGQAQLTMQLARQ